MSDTISSEIQKLREICRGWGWDLVELPEEEFESISTNEDLLGTEYSEAPFTLRKLGIHFETKRIIYCGEVFWTDVIHEMGHVFATHDPVWETNELEFFGWEYQLTKQIGADPRVWIDRNRDYGIGNLADTVGLDSDQFSDFGKLTSAQKKQLLCDRVQYARSIGLIDRKGKVCSIRS